MEVYFCGWDEFFKFGFKLPVMPELLVLGSWEAFDKSLFIRLEKILLPLFREGCFYFMCYGTDGEIIHDFIDDIITLEEMDAGVERTILTTWHNDDTPDEVAFSMNFVAMGPSSPPKNALVVSDFDKKYNRDFIKSLKKYLKE